MFRKEIFGGIKVACVAVTAIWLSKDRSIKYCILVLHYKSRVTGTVFK